MSTLQITLPRVVLPQCLPEPTGLLATDLSLSRHERDMGNQLTVDVDVMQQWKPDSVETLDFPHG